MNPQIYAIGAAADAIGRSVDTLRDWDRRGLLRAARDTRGARMYTAKDIARGRELVEEMDVSRLSGPRRADAAAA
jgi:DNA-binding transcriptional MerR regulator